MKKYFLITVLFALLLTLCPYQAWSHERRRHPPRWFEFWKGRDDDHNEHTEHHYESEDEEYGPRHKKKYSNRRFYKRHRISKDQARRIVIDSFPGWRLGPGWQRKRSGEIIIPLELQGKIIGDLKIHPVKGHILPDKFKLPPQQGRLSISQAHALVRQKLAQLLIGNRIRLGKHGSFWEVPLIFDGIEVEKIRVGSGTGDILPDWHIEEEAYNYRYAE